MARDLRTLVSSFISRDYVTKSFPRRRSASSCETIVQQCVELRITLKSAQVYRRSLARSSSGSVPVPVLVRPRRLSSHATLLWSGRDLSGSEESSLRQSDRASRSCTRRGRSRERVASRGEREMCGWGAEEKKRNGMSGQSLVAAFITVAVTSRHSRPNGNETI